MKISLLTAFFLMASGVFGQVKIHGRVADQKGKPLAGASITLRDTYDGATADSLGYYSFNSTETGEKTLEATLSGYASYAKKITIDNSSVEENILLKELITELKAVVISAGSFEAGDKKKGTVLTSLDIVTTASAEGDITGALKTLPGTQQVGETGGLFVRGGSATEAKIYIDGNLVNNFFYSSLPGISSRGRFNPFLFKGTIFSSGGYSALYGQALSAALILESNDLPEKTVASLGISVIGINGGINKLAKDKKSSWGASYSFSHLGPAFSVIKQKQAYQQYPVFHEGDANFRIKTKKGLIKYYGYLSSGDLKYTVNDIDSTSLKNSIGLRNLNTYQNLNWRENLGKGWKSLIGLSFSTDRQNLENELQNATGAKQVFANPSGYAFKNFDLETKSYYAQGRIVMEKKLTGLSVLRFGSDYFYSTETGIYTLFNGDSYDSRTIDNLYAGFAETDFYLSNNLAMKLGTRLEHSSLMERWNLAPRVSLAYKFKNNGQASVAYGQFFQNPDTKYQPAAKGIGYAKASHYILQYQKIAALKTFRTELFYKDYHHLFKTNIDNFGREVASGNNGFGYAKGIEFFWRDKKTIPNMDYWISYSFLDTRRDYLNFPFEMEPNFVARHTASLVLKKFVTKLKMNVNASYNFATGRPYYQLKYDNSQGKYLLADAGRTVNYNNLGFSLNYLPFIGKKDPKSYAVWVLSISNLLGQQQVFNYNYGSINNRREAIGPTSKRFAFIGCFLSFGVDNSDNVINNNL
ncbi:MAG: TonB-dependent receptor [Chitinophagaceae bacterium]|nr:MAG: TonB-dependent receptor [Chitinophagaceae bacterium]